MQLVIVTLVIVLAFEAVARSRRKNEIGVVNLCDANVRIRCQSVLQDKRDVFLAPHQQFRYRFVDIDRGEPSSMRLLCPTSSLSKISGTQLKCNQARRGAVDLVTNGPTRNWRSVAISDKTR
ncbi:hypothetical protein ANCCAN_20219 [Ancylostoma caninum]|uniref:Uncharacterized protein n=1 Tax=Ancylostoma caninum TaxID=29170 RepID=A0A368FT27_ANCCA|nr:hypothetical protein ANCCAN_20219 [Ancylostoma caninum]